MSQPPQLRASLALERESTGLERPFELSLLVRVHTECEVPRLPATRGYLHTKGVGETQACWAGSSAWLVGACQDCTQMVSGTRHLNGAKGWRRIEGAAALERGDWGTGQRPRRGQARCLGYHIACMPGMDMTGGGFALSGCDVVGWL